MAGVGGPNPVAELANMLVQEREGDPTSAHPTADKSPEGAYQRGASTSVGHVHDGELVQHVKQLFYRARALRRPLVETWIANYNVLRNRTWGVGRAPWMPAPEVPEVYPIIASIIGWETDQQPTFDVVPSSQPNSPFNTFLGQLATDLKTVMQVTWQIEEYDAEIEKMLWDAKLYGTGILKTGWDPTLVGGLGNATLQRIDPFTFYPDPDARGMKDSSHFIEVYTISLQELERRIPGSIEKMQGNAYTEDADVSPTVLSESPGQMPKANPGAISPATSSAYGLPGQTDRIHVTDDPGITVFEAWLRTPCEHTSTNGRGEEVTRRFDSWRCVVVAGNTVLFDEMAEAIFPHGQHPYDRFVPHDTGEFWGFSMVEMLAPSQKSINRLLAAIEHNIWLMGNPVLKETVRGGLSRTTMTNRPGQRLLMNDKDGAAWMDPPQMHPQMSSELVQFYIGEMERISGLSAIVRGGTPTGRNAEGVIETVQESAFVRIRLSLRSMERCLRSAGQKCASIITEFYDAPRMVAIVGPSGEQTSLALRPNHFYLPSPEGRLPMRFSLMVQAGSTLPTARSARIAEADTLFAMGAIDEEAVLEAHDYPGRQNIIARVREMKAAAGTLGQPPGARQRTRS